MGFLIHDFSQFIYGTIVHDGGLAVFDTGGQLVIPGASGTQVTVSGGKGDIVNAQPAIGQGGHDLIQVNPTFTDRITVLLFAGDLTGMTAGAVFVIYH